MHATVRVRRWLRRHLRPRAVILGYHRVARVASDPFLLAVTPEHFDEHLGAIARYARPMGLAALGSATANGALRSWTTVVTLDDGYADSLLAAKPLLERHGIPATVFVTTGQLDATREFWWDELERLLLEPGNLPAPLLVPAGGVVHRWDVSGAGIFTAADAAASRTWHYGWRIDPTPRHRLFRAVYTTLRSLAPDVRRQSLDGIAAAAGKPIAARPSHRALTTAEVGRLADGGLVDVGSHTVSHPELHRLPVDRQRDEVAASKRRLEAILGRAVDTFAYPYGAHGPETRTIVRETGYLAACTDARGPVQPTTDPFELPRFTVSDCDGEAFTRSLEEWL